MKNYTICVCDDDILIRKKLKDYLLRYSFKHDVDINLIELDSAEKLLDLKEYYDILFLDIRFNGKNIGIDIAEKLRNTGNTTIIIIITALKAMSIDSYRAEPLRFIIKPFKENEFESAMNACICKLNRVVSYIKIISDSITELIRTDRILYIYSRLRKRQIVCQNNEVIGTWQSLNNLMRDLPNEKFSYTHKSYIVNLDAVDTVINDKIALENGDIIPLGSHFKDSFMKALLLNIHKN